jgi:hypothetical protein
MSFFKSYWPHLGGALVGAGALLAGGQWYAATGGT